MNEQNTQAWHADRCGNITASALKKCTLVTPEKYKVIRPTGTTLKVCATEQEALEVLAAALEKKPGFSLAIEPAKPLLGFLDYASQLVCERLTGVVKEIGEPPAIRWGNDHEPYALRAYENRTGNIVEACGFIPAPATTGLVNYGGSPDGLVGTDGSIEAKCPLDSSRHLVCFVSGIPEEHYPQLEGQLIATGRDWVDFISYDPRFTGDYEHLQLFVCRYVSRPELREELVAAICRMEAHLVAFINSLPKKGDM